MKKPTIQEVADYCAERGNGIDPEAFLDHYEMVGWVYGKHRQPIKSWKAAVRTWERQGKRHTREQRPRYNGYRGRDENLEAMAVQLGLPAKPGESTEAWHMRIRGAMSRAH